MAVTFDAASSNQTTGTVITFPHTVTGDVNRYLAVSLCTGFDATITSITYTGVALTQRLTQLNAAGTRKVWYYDLVAPAAGTNNIVVTFGESNAASICGQSCYGVDQTTPRSNTNTASGTSAAPAMTLTSAVGEIALAFVGWRSVGPITDTPDATWTTDSNLENGSQGGSGAHEDGAASVTRTDALSGSASWAVVGASLTAGAAPDTIIGGGAM